MIFIRRNLIICIALSAGPSLVYSQAFITYTVVKVSGEVRSLALNKNVETGDKIKSTDQLIFDNASSYLHVVNPTEGLKTLHHAPDNSPHELIQLFDTFRSGSTENLKSRGGGTEYIEELTSLFTSDTLLILGHGWIPVDTTRMSLTAPSGISAHYGIGRKFSQPTISKGGGFSLDKELLFGSATVRAYPQVTLYYCPDLSDPYFTPPTMFAAFVPFYADEAQVLNEVRTITAAMSPASDRAHTIDLVIKYLSGEYAQPMKGNLGQWLIDNSLLK